VINIIARFGTRSICRFYLGSLSSFLSGGNDETIYCVLPYIGYRVGGALLKNSTHQLFVLFQFPCVSSNTHPDTVPGSFLHVHMKKYVPILRSFSSLVPCFLYSLSLIPLVPYTPIVPYTPCSFYSSFLILLVPYTLRFVYSSFFLYFSFFILLVLYTSRSLYSSFLLHLVTCTPRSLYSSFLIFLVPYTPRSYILIVPYTPCSLYFLFLILLVTYTPRSYSTCSLYSSFPKLPII